MIQLRQLLTPLFPFCISVLFIILATGSSMADPTFSVAPGVFTLDLNQTRSAALILTNTGNERIRLVVTPVYFPVDSKSLQAGKSLDKDFNNKDDISGLIIVSPRVVVLSPGQKRHVRFSVRMKEKMPLGDYRAHLLVNIKESQNPELVSKGAVDGSQTMSIRLNIKLQTAVAVYGRIESPDTKLEVSCEQVEKNKLVIHSRNKSRWNYRGWMGIYQSEDQDPDNPTELIRLINLRESERTINTSQEYNAKRVLRWGLKKEQLNDGVQACSTK